MKNFAFCTLTYGIKYIEYGDTLISQLNNLGYHVFVLTDDVNHYIESDLLTAIQYQKNYFSFHEKRTIVKECLKNYSTAIFLDSDVYLKNVTNLDIFENIDSGLHIFSNFGNIGQTFLNDDISKCTRKGDRNTKYGKKGIKLLDNLGYIYEKLYDNIDKNYIEHFLEGRWVIKKDGGREDIFFNIWDTLVDFCENFDIDLNYVDSIGAGEGSVMSIAAYNSKIKIHNVSNLTEFINNHFISNYKEKLNNTKPWNIAG
jgi:hypothetical protein